MPDRCRPVPHACRAQVMTGAAPLRGAQVTARVTGASGEAGQTPPQACAARRRVRDAHPGKRHTASSRPSRTQRPTAAELLHAWGLLGVDERRVVLAVAQRLSVGARAYGPLRIMADPRSWTGEALAEALDLSAYLAFELLRRSAP
jgi:hypothetical protein